MYAFQPNSLLQQGFQFKGIVGKICRGEGRSSDNNERPREKNYYEVIENNQLPSINKNERWKDSEK
jgi:hypothetical protein